MAPYITSAVAHFSLTVSLPSSVDPHYLGVQVILMDYLTYSISNNGKANEGDWEQTFFYQRRQDYFKPLHPLEVASLALRWIYTHNSSGFTNHSGIKWTVLAIVKIVHKAIVVAKSRQFFK